MNQENLKKWTKALRSGEFVQIFRAYKNRENGRCALGVLADIYEKENPHDEFFISRSINPWLNSGSDYMIPLFMNTAIRWVLPEYGQAANDQLNIMDLMFSLNDDQRRSFDEIADELERRFLNANQ